MPNLAAFIALMRNREDPEAALDRAVAGARKERMLAGVCLSCGTRRSQRQGDHPCAECLASDVMKE